MKKLIFWDVVTVKVDLEPENSEKWLKAEKQKNSFLGHSDFTDVLIKKLVYIRFDKLGSSYVLAPGEACSLKGY